MARKAILLACLFCVAIGIGARAQSVSLAWNASPEPGVTGYRLYQGSASRSYSTSYNVGNATAFTVNSLIAGTNYFFAVTAANGFGVESTFSSEVSYRPPIPSPTPSSSPTSSPSPTPSPSPTSSPSPSATASPSPAPTAGPSPTPGPSASPTPTLLAIAGTVRFCGTQAPAVGIEIVLSGGVGEQYLSDAFGRFMFLVPPGGSYLISPVVPAPLLPGAPGINLVDVLAIQRAFLDPLNNPLPCPAAGDVTLEGRINSVDAIAVYRFALGIPSGLVGSFRIAPGSRELLEIQVDQVGQDFEIRILGDVQ